MDKSWESSVVYHPELFGPYLRHLCKWLGPTDEALNTLNNIASTTKGSGWVLQDASSKTIDHRTMITNALEVRNSNTPGTAPPEAVTLLVRTPPSRFPLVVRVCTDLSLRALDLSGVELRCTGVESLAHALTNIPNQLRVLKLKKVNCKDAGTYLHADRCCLGCRRYYTVYPVFA
eukprot:1307245-Pyramimonas_sp.AAC.1